MQPVNCPSCQTSDVVPTYDLHCPHCGHMFEPSSVPDEPLDTGMNTATEQDTDADQSVSVQDASDEKREPGWMNPSLAWRVPLISLALGALVNLIFKGIPQDGSATLHTVFFAALYIAMLTYGIGMSIVNLLHARSGSRHHLNHGVAGLLVNVSVVVFLAYGIIAANKARELTRKMSEPAWVGPVQLPDGYQFAYDNEALGLKLSLPVEFAPVPFSAEQKAQNVLAAYQTSAGFFQLHRLNTIIPQFSPLKIPADDNTTMSTVSWNGILLHASSTSLELPLYQHTTPTPDAVSPTVAGTVSLHQSRVLLPTVHDTFVILTSGPDPATVEALQQTILDGIAAYTTWKPGHQPGVPPE